MPSVIRQITSILGGQAPLQYNAREDQYSFSIAVDPGEPLSSSDKRKSGVLMPTAASKISGSEVTAEPNWLLANPKNTHGYAYAGDGKLHSFTDALAMRSTDGAGTSLPITVASSNGNGAAYYNNYIYLAQKNDIARYGPLIGRDDDTTDVAMNESWWTETTDTVYGFSSATSPNQIAIDNKSAVALGGFPMPNHPMHVHGNELFFGDTGGGLGLIHRIKTTPVLDYDDRDGNFAAGLTLTGATSGATALIITADNGVSTGRLTITDINGTFQNNEDIVDGVSGDATVNGIITEGLANNSSEYAALRLPSGFLPSDIESFGSDLVIAANQSTDTGVNQGQAAIFFWDTQAGSFYNQVNLPDPICSALLWHNGILYGWSGNGRAGYRLWRYVGGDTVETLAYMDDGTPPLAGCVTSDGERIAWGHQSIHPTEAAGVLAWGFRDGRLPKGLHNIARSSRTDTGTIATSLFYYVQSDATSTRKIILGFSDFVNFGIDKPDTGGTFASTWRSGKISVGFKFRIKNITLPLGAAVAANMTLTPKVFVDNESRSETQTVINDTNYPNSERVVTLNPTIAGKTDFNLELVWTGTVALPVLLPITVELEPLTRGTS